MKALLIATLNPGKLREITQFLSDLPLNLVSLSDLGISDEFQENGKTFEENARNKALFYAKRANLPTIADDGGLEIDALGGIPGVYSKRWIGKENATTQEYIDFTLEKMKHLSIGKRGAHLRAVIAFAFLNGEVFTVDTSMRGIIPEKPSKYREEGFPYRSLLFIPEINKFYNHDELTKEEEKRYNHRYKGLSMLSGVIREKFIDKV